MAGHTSINFRDDEDKNLNNEIDLLLHLKKEESDEFKAIYFIINLAIGGTLTDATI